MNFKEFTEEVIKKLREVLPEQMKDAEIEVKEMQKINQTYQAMIIKNEGETASPSIDIDRFYWEYRDGRDTDSIADEIAKIAEVRPEFLGITEIRDYSIVKDKLFIRVCDAETNKELLKNIPYKVMGGLAVTAHVLIEADSEGAGSIMVNEWLLRSFGVSKERLFEDAIKSSPIVMPPSVMPMEAMMERLLGFEPEGTGSISFEEQLDRIGKDETMTVLTNSGRLNGAAVIFYPEVMEKISEKTGCDMFILPSSVHEVILVPDNKSFELEMLEDMVRNVNDTEVEAKDLLSYDVLHYDSRERIIEKAKDHELRSKGLVKDENKKEDSFIKPEKEKKPKVRDLER